MAFKQEFSNFYTQDGQTFDPSTLPPDEIIRRAMHSERLKINVWLPVKVTKIVAQQKVNLQPLLKTMSIPDRTLRDLPEIQNVMVWLPRGADYHIRLPVAEGDLGIALFCDRSLDNWSAGTGTDTVDPQDSRNHDFQDAIFIPGLYPFSEAIDDDTDDMIVKNGDSEVRIKKDGTYLFANQEQELMDLLDQTLQNILDLYAALQNDTYTLTQLGPQPFIASTIAKLAELESTADTIKSNLDTLKGES